MGRVAARAAVMLAVLLVTASADARSEGAEPADLAGIVSVRVNVSQTTPDAMACGIDLRELLPTVSEGLVTGGLTVDRSADATVTLTILTGYDQKAGMCATAPMLGAYRKVSYFDEKVGWLRSGQVVLWQRGTATATPAADHPGAVQRAVTALTQALLASWRTANAAGIARR